MGEIISQDVSVRLKRSLGHYTDLTSLTTQLLDKAKKVFVTPEELAPIGTVVGNGNVDDSTLLNNAFSYASTNKLTVKLMNGKTYRAKNVTLPANTTIDGCGATIMLTDNANKNNNDKLLITYSAHVTVRDLILDGNVGVVAGDPFNGCNLFYTIGASYLTVENVIFQNSGYCGITIGDIDKVRINGCKFMNIDAGIISNSNYCYNATITNNHFDGHGASEPITISGDVLNQNIIITGNTILNKTSGLGIIVGREIPYDADNTSRSYKVVIGGNVIDGVMTGIQLNNVDGANIYGNIIKNTGNHGISVTRLGKNIDVFDNLMDTMGLACVDLSKVTSGNVKVHDNTLKNPNNSNDSSTAYSFIFTAGDSTGVANRIVDVWFENNLLYSGVNGTAIQLYITGTIRFNENEFVPYSTERLSVQYQTAKTIASKNTNMYFIGSPNAQNRIDNGYVVTNGTTMGTTLDIYSFQGFETIFVDNTQGASSSSLNTIPTQYDGKKLTLIIKSNATNSTALDQTGNLILQSSTYTLNTYTFCIFNFVCYGGKWYELNHTFH